MNLTFIAFCLHSMLIGSPPSKDVLGYAFSQAQENGVLDAEKRCI